MQTWQASSCQLGFSTTKCRWSMQPFLISSPVGCSALVEAAEDEMKEEREERGVWKERPLISLCENLVFHHDRKS